MESELLINEMDRASFFIENKAIFGGYPTQESTIELENIGVRYFVDLTYNHEKGITPYKTNYEHISFPIMDRRIPYDWKSFARFILQITSIIKGLKDGEMVYLHCKGGHGRSGLVVACLYCYIYNMSPEQAIIQTTIVHSKRKIMRDKWRKLGSPQTQWQKNFVYKFFEPILFYRAYNTGRTAGFSNFTLHKVNIPDIGTFPTAEAAIQAYKNPSDPEYVSNQLHAKTPVISKSLGRKIIVNKDWESILAERYMFYILKCKFDQHTDLRDNLINTGLRPIIQHTRGDNFWGDGGDGTGGNRLGKTLVRLRNWYYINLH